MALFLADRGEGERAAKLYALTSRYPFMTNSRWFKNVAGKHAAALSQEVVTAAQEHGRAQELENTVAELLVEQGGGIVPALARGRRHPIRQSIAM